MVKDCLCFLHLFLLRPHWDRAVDSKDSAEMGATVERLRPPPLELGPSFTPKPTY